ncbi:MAG: single-stranded-DNA-specific exonuclease RecJ [Candidatus Sericytochromatia bacterium]
MRNNSEWIFNPINYEKAYPLSEQIGVSLYTAQLLINREIQTPEESNTFLTVPHHLEMKSWDIDTSKKIGELIKKAIKNQDLITVHGDYDVDGVTGASVLSQFLKNKGANFSYYLPDRFGDGYGLNPNVIKNLAENGTKVLITADCGISNNNEIDLARSLGIKVIVTDHHTLPEVLPNADYIFHPALSDNKDFHILSGVGTAFQLICDIDKMIDSVKDSRLDDYIDLVVMGTIADISPLKGINRQIVQFGLSKMKNTNRIGLLKLFEKSNIKIKELTARDISHKISPRINAAGRMNKAVIALELLLSETEEEAEILSQRLEDLNNQRRELSEKTFKEVEEIITNEIDLDKEKAIIIAGEHFHHGVIGIICSRVLDKYNRPVFIMAKEGEFSRGSTRSHSINVVDALKSAEDILVKFGGHHGAAGWSVKTENIDLFKQKILEFMDKNLTSKDLIPKINIEVEIPVDKIDYYVYRELQDLEPFGLTNPEPVIGMRNCIIKDQYLSKNGLHLFFTALNPENPEKTIKASYWYGGTNYPLPDKANIIYSINENSWQGKISLQLKINNIQEEKKEEVLQIKKLTKIEKETSLEIEFPIKELMTESINSGYLSGSFGQHKVNFPIDIKTYEKKLNVIDKRSCINRFIELEKLYKEFGFENISIFSTGKVNIDCFKEIKVPNNTQKHLVIWDLPLKKQHIHHIINIIEADNIYMFFEKNNNHNKTINANILKDILKNLYVNTDSMNNFVNSCFELNLEKKHISIALEFLTEAKYILNSDNKNFLRIPEQGIRLSELNSYKNYIQDIEEYELFCNIMLKGSLNKINDIIGVKI